MKIKIKGLLKGLFIFISGAILAGVVFIATESLGQNKQVTVDSISSDKEECSFLNDGYYIPSDTFPSVNKEQKYKNLARLATEVHINYFKKFLGDPAFINLSRDKSQKEYIFVDKDFYVQAITDRLGKVLLYAVTTRKKDFNPSFDSPAYLSSGNEKDKAILGKSNIKEIAPGDNPLICFGFVGMTANSFYHEEYSFGNVSFYQKYLYGVNDAGYLSKEGLPYYLASLELENKLQPKERRNDEQDNEIEIYDCNSIPDQIRRKTVINTFVVVSRDIGLNVYDEIKFQIGADRLKTRLISE